LPLIDLTALAQPCQSSEQNRLAQQESQRPFDLTRGPLLRAALVLLRGSVGSSQLAVGSSETEAGDRKPETGTSAETVRSSQLAVGSPEAEEASETLDLGPWTLDSASDPPSEAYSLQPPAYSLPPTSAETVRSSQSAVGSPEAAGASETLDSASDAPSEAYSLQPPAYSLPPPASCLLLTLHHIITDGWSMDILTQELSVFYRAFAAKRPEDPRCEPRTANRKLPPLPLQYADFAIWQRQWLSGEVLETQLHYWRRQLEAVPPLELPGDRPRPANPSFRGGSMSFVWPADLAGGLGVLSRGQDTTLFMTLLAAFQALLGRWSGQDDVAVGTPIANRNREETEGLIGFFVNTLVMRNDLSGDLSFAELLKRVRETALQAYAHQDVPFEAVVEALQPERSLNRTPLFQVMFALQNAPSRPVEVQGLEISGLESPTVLSKFDLTVTLTEVEAGLAGSLEYSSDLFDASTVRRLAGHFRNLAQGMVRDCQPSLFELPLMSEGERHQLITELSNPATRWRSKAAEEGIGGLIRDQIGRREFAVAAVFADRHLTYGELGRQAGLVATWLVQQQIGPDSLVGVMADRSPEMVAAFCGIIQAGAAYLPLDPDFPAQRLEFMLSDTQARAVLVQRSLRGRLPSSDQPVVELEALLHDHPGIASDRWRRVAPDSLAYVIYTSGSTGRPKGVAVPQRAIPRLLIETDYIRLESDDRVAQAASSTFDAITFELWGALANGGCLVGVERETLWSAAEFANWMQRQAVTCMFLTTALFNRIAAEQPGAFRNLGNLLFGGETSDPRAVERILQSEPPRRLLHVYGPTETTTFASWFEVFRLGRAKSNQLAVGSWQLAVQTRNPEPGTRLPTDSAEVPGAGFGVPGTDSDSELPTAN
ncbi:MAG: condensation domain-containing protein, partial [Acidobacteriota bacterium]